MPEPMPAVSGSLGTLMVITMLPAELAVASTGNVRGLVSYLDHRDFVALTTKPLPWMVICWPGTTIAGWIGQRKNADFSEAVADGVLSSTCAGYLDGLGSAVRTGGNHDLEFGTAVAVGPTAVLGPHAASVTSLAADLDLW